MHGDYTAVSSTTTCRRGLGMQTSAAADLVATNSTAVHGQPSAMTVALAVEPAADGLLSGVRVGFPASP
jgi:hypothetical protein